MRAALPSAGRCRESLAWVLVLSLASLGCIQPRTPDDDFGTGGASIVTGDAPEDAGDPEPTSEETSTDASPAPRDASASGPTSKPDAARPVDAGVPAAQDAGAVEPTADAAAPPPTTTGPTKLSFSVQTVSPNGKYSPRNIYAIWVVDAQGKFVKTLAKFARTRAIYLTAWNATSLGNVVDAVSGATVSSHGVRDASWDLTDATGNTVPDGDYKIVVELTDADRSGPSTSIAFHKGPDPVRLTPANATNFTNMSLVLE